MIFKLKGTIDLKIETKIILNVNNISYEINVSEPFFNSVNTNDNLEIFTTQIIKEDDHSIYGFKTLFDKIWFENLIKIDGLGAKIAIKLMSKLDIDQISNAILSKDHKAFEQISGIGAKIANRIVNEMTNKLAKIDSYLLTLGHEKSQDIKPGNVNSEIFDHAISAINSLGFTSSDTKKTVLKIISEFEKEEKKYSAEDIVSKFLKK